MTMFETVLQKRDNITTTEAKKRRQEATDAIYCILDNGGSYDEVEEMLADEYGLEIDYIFDLL